MLADWEIKKYAQDRINDLTRAIAGCLTPTTLEALQSDLTDNANHPVSRDFTDFAAAMAKQQATLTE